MGIKELLGKTKIPLNPEAPLGKRGNVIGFRSVVGGLGTTSLISNIAVYLGSQGRQVAVLDLDFINPSSLLFDETLIMASVLPFFSTNSVNAMNYANITKYKNVKYLGLGKIMPMSDICPSKIDDDYIRIREQLIKDLITQIREKFDAVLIDIPTDIRNIDGCLATKYCSELIWLNEYSVKCLPRLYEDLDIVASMNRCRINIVQVDKLMEVPSNYNDIKGCKYLSTIQFSKAVEYLLNKKQLCDLSEDNMKHEDVQGYVYYEGTKRIIKYIQGGTTND